MSEERQETIDDIVKEIRGNAEHNHALVEVSKYLTEIADRIEAAMKREREAGAEAAQICGEIGEIIGREATCEKSSQVGNAATMREALEKVRFYLPHFFQYMKLHREDDEAGGYYERILEVVNAALSSPPRNCDRQLPAESVSADDVEQAWCVFKRCATDVYFDVPGLLRFIVWLFAEAKGATDGSK